MHVVIIPSERYVTRRSPLAGVFQYQQAHALSEKGTKVGVISAGFVPFSMMFAAYPYEEFEVDRGVPTYRIYKRTALPGRVAIRILWAYLVRLYQMGFEKYVREQCMPDIVHAHNCLFAGVVALKIKDRYGIPYIVTEHSSVYGRGLLSRRQAKLTREVLRNADRITVVSKALGARLEKLFGADACPNLPIFNILDAEFEGCGSVLNDVKEESDFFTFLSIGSLDSNKNHRDLLSAFASRFAGDSRVKLRIGGAGPLLRALEQQVEELGLQEQVVFTGMLGRDSVLREMRDCSVFVLPSVFETFGVVLIEALAMGKPIVATMCGGPEDIVNERNGILVPVKDVEALAKAMWDIRLNIDRYDARAIRSDCLLRFGKDSFVKRLQGIYAGIRDTKKRIDNG